MARAVTPPKKAKSNAISVYLTIPLEAKYEIALPTKMKTKLFHVMVGEK